MRKDLIFGTSVLESLSTVTVSGGGDDGVTIDTLNKYAAKHILHVEAVTTAIVIKLQDSPDDSVWTDVPATKMIGGVNSATVGASDDNSAVQIAGANLDRYQRIQTVSGAGVCHAVAVLADNLGS